MSSERPGAYVRIRLRPGGDGWPRLTTSCEPNKNPALRRGFRSRLCLFGLRRNSGLFLGRLAQHVAAAPHRLDVVLAVGGVRELLAQLADEHVDDLELGLVHAAVEMVEEHLLGERRALAEREQLQHLIFLAGQVHAGAAHFDGLLVEVDGEVAGVDDRLGVALGAAHDGVDARDQLVLVERLGHVVVGAEAQALHLVLDAGEAGEDQDRGLDLGDPQRAQNLEAGHVRQVQVEQDDVVVVELAEIDALFAEIGGVDVEALGFEHQLDRLRSGAVVLNQQDAHASPLLRRCGLKVGTPQRRPVKNALGQTDSER